MEASWSHYYGIIQNLSLLTGMWPYLKPRTRLLRVVLLTTIVLTIFVPQIAHQFTCKQDLQCIFESMTSCLLTSVGMVKVWSFQLNIRQIKSFTEHLFVDWKELETPQEYEIMRSYAENCRRFSLLYPVYCFSAVYIFMSVSIVPPILDIVSPLNESRPVLLPYPGYYFVDSRKYFFYIFGHSIFSWEMVMAGIVAHDCMFVSYVEHLCSMFAVVGSRFEDLFRNSDDAVEDAKGNLDDVYRKKIALFVHTHRKTLKFAQTLESTFTVPFAVQLLIIIGTMSCTLLQITQQEAGMLELIRYILYVIGQLFHLFCLSFEGQKLIDHSLRMRDKIYNSLWYKAPLKSRKLLILTMMQSLRPTVLSAGKVYIFSLESFTTVLQTSMSYFTVLSTFQ
ncbi:odorant receptor 4 isoform X1 [Harpegnathos saltator]|uniref:odorant receptor 4 isoform X1 n=1 Tax=Harpegnathos saltator TaxID=610380 RepID=UPI000948B06D|nr:odorant receptor 4 isoform X1 [Harpegnathos saltator]